MAKNFRDPVQTKRVRKFSNRFELLESFSPKALIILKCLGAGNSERDAAKAAGSAKSTVTYWKDKFLDLGLLQLVSRDVFQIFRFTPFGSKLVTTSEGLSEVRVLEDYPWKFDVVEGERRRIDWVKLGCPRNWEKLGVRIGGVRVVRTSGSLIIHPGRFKGWDERDLEALAVRTVEWVRQVLEGRFGMVLSDVGVRLHEPVFRFFSEEAKEDVKHGTVIVDGVGSVDASPPECIPHEEYQGVERARARLLLPDTIKRLEGKVDAISNAITDLANALSKPIEQLTVTLQKLVPAEAPAEAMPRNGAQKEYVS